MSALFQATTHDGRLLRLTKEGWSHIRTVHPELQGELEKVNQTMKPPDLIKQGNRADTLMFYKFFSKTIVSRKYLALVIKYLNTKGLVPQDTSLKGFEKARFYGKDNNVLLRKRQRHHGHLPRETKGSHLRGS